jgi:transposase-like protein
MMPEHGLELAHTTIMRWVQRYVPESEKSYTKIAAKDSPEFQTWAILRH